jgi:hypothetical protein
MDMGPEKSVFFGNLDKRSELRVENWKEIDRYSDEFRDLQEKLYRFVWETWFNQPLEDTYNFILRTLKKENLYLDAEPGNLSILYERFSGAAANPIYYQGLSLEELFLLNAKLESLLSVPKRFKYGWEKLRGIDRPLPKSDPLDFTNSIVSDISKLLMKANKAGRIGYLDTLGNRF